MRSQSASFVEKISSRNQEDAATTAKLHLQQRGERSTYPSMQKDPSGRKECPKRKLKRNHGQHGQRKDLKPRSRHLPPLQKHQIELGCLASSVPIHLGRRLRTTFGSAKSLADRWFPRHLAVTACCKALLGLVTITSPWTVWRCWSWPRMVPSRLVTLARCLG